MYNKAFLFSGNRFFSTAPFDDDFDDDKLTEESYRTTFDTNPEELEIQAEEVGDDDDF